MRYGLLIETYLAGPEILRRSVSGMSDQQLDATPIPFSGRHDRSCSTFRTSI